VAILPAATRHSRVLARALLLLGLLAAPIATQPACSNTRYHVVVFITDDQRFDTLWAMPILQDRLISRGVEFTRAYVTTPSCCPTRSSFLAGGYYSHDTGVLDNGPPNGGSPRFVDTDTLPRRLQQRGYKTFLVGKYLNNHVAPYVPPGWDRFLIKLDNGEMLSGSTGAEPGVGVPIDRSGYREDSYKQEALAFIDENLGGSAPLFIYFSTNNPHWPANPHPQDAGGFPGYVYRERGYVPGSYSDKVTSAAEEDEFHRDQLRSLQVVDRAIGEIVDRFAAAGELHRTVFVFTSDNGYMWGEHGLFGKDKAYEESVRIPLVVVTPGVAARTDDHLVAMNLDVPATILELSGSFTLGGDGKSLLPLLTNPNRTHRTEIFFEHFDGPWAGLLWRDGAQEWKYAEVPEETKTDLLFDLTHDPYELDNKVDDPAYQGVVADLKVRLDAQKALTITYGRNSAPSARLGDPYSFQVPFWGGVPPYTWRITEGALPPGLGLDPATGLISGIPTAGTHDHEVWVEVTDSSLARQAGLPRRHAKLLRFDVRNDVDGDGVHDADDNCPSTSNPDQADADGDGFGNLCESFCADGLDNDGDGHVDFPADPGCVNAASFFESPDCNDGIDNDGDHRIDYPADGACAAPYGTTEERIRCGLGSELLFWLPALAWLRRRRRGAPALVLALVLAAAPDAGALKRADIAGWVFDPLTDNGAPDELPRVANQRFITWSGSYHLPGASSATTNDPEIYLWDALTDTRVQITDDDADDLRPVVNNLGELAWMKFGVDAFSEIYVRSGGVTTRVTNDVPAVQDRYPDISDSGWVVWGRWSTANGWHAFATYNLHTSAFNFLPAVPAYRTKINNHDVIVVATAWFRAPDGTILQTLPTAAELGYSAVRRSSINDSEQLFLEMDPSPNPSGDDKEGPRDILFWDGSEAHFIFSSSTWAGRGELNGSGVLVWEGTGGLPGTTSVATDREIFVFDPAVGEVEQITDDDVEDRWPSVMDDGTVVWQGKGNYPGSASGGSENEVFRAYVDRDQDGAADVSDDCPGLSNPDQADADGDGVGDLCDIACSDGLDNDRDGRIDHPADPHCEGPSDPNEGAGGACGLGPELAFLLAVASRLRRRKAGPLGD
jgi:arylsulfatase A-like enzyme